MADRTKARFTVETPPEAPWPVVAKRLLSHREREFYDALLALYPDHRLFIQVSLSQIVDVPRDHPERYSIRARFSQLVADFVLCRQDLTIVAVVELDDRSHENPLRRAADARKTKALSDAGLRLVRIPAGPLPSVGRLREIMEEPLVLAGTSNDEHPLALQESDFIAPVESSTPHHELVASAAIRSTLVKAAVGAVVVIVMCLIYIQVVPHALQSTMELLGRRAVSAARARMLQPMAPARVAPPPAMSARTRQDLESGKNSDFGVNRGTNRQKERDWAAYYQPPASCEHPGDWSAQVECGNMYMRARKAFEMQWSKSHGMTRQCHGSQCPDGANHME